MQTLQASSDNGHGYSDWHLNVDFQSRSAKVDLRPVRLTNKEFELLEFLVRNAGDVVKSTVLLGKSLATAVRHTPGRCMSIFAACERSWE